MMTAHSYPFSKIITVEQGAREHYHVPKYQREYTWGWREWEQLLQDIDENDPGYFLGSIICIKDGDPEAPGDEMIYEVIDGQQRLTTLSLLLLAIYDRLKQMEETATFADDDDLQAFRDTISGLRSKLVKKKKDFRKAEPGGFMDGKSMVFCRVRPSSQNHNLADYLYRFWKLGLIGEQPKPPHSGNRLITRALRYFISELPTTREALQKLVTKINELQFVLITVGSQSDAFTLFETLNNRGVPLSATDIIKNKMLAEMQSQHNMDVDESYEQWQEVIRSIPEASDQERFLRHFYNAFRSDPKIRVEGVPRAIKSKIIHIYESLIRRDARSIFDHLIEKGRVYGRLISPDETESPALRERLEDLARIGGTPAYQVLLYLFSLPPKQLKEPNFLEQALDLLSTYYVRRNITDTPPTRELDASHMELIEEMHGVITNAGVLPFVAFAAELLTGRGAPASMKQFREALSGPIYATNVGMARYLLCKLDSMHHTREYKPDLWARDERDRFVWTIEHVLPQTERLSADWVDMMGGGDKEAAKEAHARCVNCLGNLTLSGYNSKLATASLAKKQELGKDKSFLGHKINIGYRNRLALNELEFPVGKKMHNLANVPRWDEAAVCSRTKEMVDRLADLYRFPGER